MNGYLVTVEGDYFGMPRSGDRKKEKFPYRIQVKVPSPEGALSLIKNKLLDKVLRRNFGNYYAYRTHQLVSITNVDGSKVYGLTDPRLMDFNDLAVYVKQNKLPLKLELYTDLGYFRTMVHLAETNQREFLIKQADLARDSEEDRLLAELNPDLLGGGDIGSQPLEPKKYAGGTTLPNSVNGITKQTVAANPDNVGQPDTTVIVEGERPTVSPESAQSKDGQLFQTVDAPASNMITEDKPEAQKVEKVFIPGQGFVDVDKFKENFEKPEEEEFEVYDPAGIGELKPNVAADVFGDDTKAENPVSDSEVRMTATEAAERNKEFGLVDEL